LYFIFCVDFSVICFLREGPDIKKESLDLAKNVYKIEMECIKEMEEHFNEEAFAKAVELLKNAPRIGTSGCGHSGIICQHLAHLLCCIEQPARFISPAEAVHGGSGFLQKGDVMVLASRGGKTKELIPIAEICRKKEVFIIVVTENMDSVLAQMADVVLKQHVNRETDKYNAQGTTSTTALCVLFHTLTTALMEETDFQNEQFALIHPGGAVGERLNQDKI
jgi:D-arabinose 5-phosphate isomerase GutQ